MSGRGPYPVVNAHPGSGRPTCESAPVRVVRMYNVFLLLTLDDSTPTPTHVRDTNTCCRVVFRAACSLWCWLHARFPLPRPRRGLPRSGTHFHSGRRGATAHTLHRTTRHPRRHGHETYHSDPRIIFEGEGSGVCAQGVAVAPSGAAGAEHLAPAGIHASSRPPAAIKPPRCRVLRRLNICRRTGDA